jgi:hypothetical protein
MLCRCHFTNALARNGGCGEVALNVAVLVFIAEPILFRRSCVEMAGLPWPYLPVLPAPKHSNSWICPLVYLVMEHDITTHVIEHRQWTERATGCRLMGTVHRKAEAKKSEIGDRKGTVPLY